MPARSAAYCASAPKSCARTTCSSCTSSAGTMASALPRSTSHASSKKVSPPSPRKPTMASACTGAPTRSARSAAASGRPAMGPVMGPRCICSYRWVPVNPPRSPGLPEVIMADPNSTPIRVLVVDDEAEVRDAYRQILLENEVTQEMVGFRELRSRLFRKDSADTARERSPARAAGFEPVFCDSAEAAVTAVKESLARNEPFAVVFLDMRMPPGPDGAWAATRIRELDPAVEIVICTAYSDVDPCEIGGMAPPEDKLSYLQKPFHPHEIRQLTIGLSSKWRAERRIVKLAYFDTLTGLPNREQSRNRLVGALQAAKDNQRTLAVLYLDLDNFKRVNDTLGHAVGDELLCVVAERLRSSLRADDAVDDVPSSRSSHIARLGGDEFIVILPNIRSADDAAAVAARLI